MSRRPPAPSQAQFDFAAEDVLEHLRFALEVPELKIDVPAVVQVEQGPV